MTNEELALKVKNGEEKYINELWENTFRVMYLMAGKFYNKYEEALKASGVALDDLRQECYFGMLKAIEYYDESKDYKFITYLHFPLKNRFSQLAGWRTSKKEPLNEYKSLYDSVGDAEEDIMLIDTVEDKDSAEPFNKMLDSVFSEEVHEVLDEVMNQYLSVEQKDILEMYFYQGKRAKEIARLYNYRANKVSEIKRRALRKLSKGNAILLLEPFRDEIISHNAMKYTGVSSFNKTRTSATERTAMLLYELRESEV